MLIILRLSTKHINFCSGCNIYITSNCFFLYKANSEYVWAMSSGAQLKLIITIIHLQHASCNWYRLSLSGNWLFGLVKIGNYKHHEQGEMGGCSWLMLFSPSPLFLQKLGIWLYVCPGAATFLKMCLQLPLEISCISPDKVPSSGVRQVVT